MLESTSEASLEAGDGSRSRRYEVATGSLDGKGPSVAAPQSVAEVNAAPEHKNCVQELENALAQAKQLSRHLARCFYCKRIGDGEDHWQEIPLPAAEQWDARFSSSICRDCYEAFVKPEVTHVHAYLRDAGAERNGWNGAVAFRLSRS